MKIDIIYYSSNGTYKGKIKNIKNIDKIQYNEIINGGQGGFTLELGVNFDNLDYSYGDLVEYVIYNDQYKNGIHKFTGVIKGIKRNINIEEGESITLDIKGLISLLNDYTITKTYSGSLNQVLDTFISDFHSNFNLSEEMIYLGTDILKNTVQNTDNINISVDGDFYSALEKIFGDNKSFFINKLGEIKLISEINDEKVFTMNRNIYEAEIDENGSIDLYIAGYKDLQVEVGQNIVIENINSQLDLEGKRINEMVFSLDKIFINAGKILNYKNN